MDADDVMTCPAGVALLESLEAEQRSDAAWFHALTTSDAAAVDRAATAMAAVAEAFDGVHVSWTGKLTCDGRIIEVPALGDHAVSLVRYWASGRTLWLNDVFDNPVPLVAPVLSGRINGDTGADATDPRRRQADMATITARLGRNPFTP